jgi:hypothetical protein
MIFCRHLAVIFRKQQPLLQLRKSLINSDGQSAFSNGYTLYPGSLQRTENITNRTVTRGTLIILRHSRASIATLIHCYACEYTALGCSETEACLIDPLTALCKCLRYLVHYGCCWFFISLCISTLRAFVRTVASIQLMDRSRESSVGIAMGYGLDGRSSIPGRGKGFFSIPQGLDRPTHPRIQWISGVKWPGREANNSFP